MPNCPFCDLTSNPLWSSDLTFAMVDTSPVSPGHTLVIPKRHVATYFDATPWEQQSLWQGVEAVKRLLDEQYEPHGYNVGFNSGEAAGQTVPHLHIHVIPRYRGDMADPQGGVRGVIPAKQKYKSALAVIKQEPTDPFRQLATFVPGQGTPFLPVLRQAIGLADNIDIVSAFIQPSGLIPLLDHLADALHRGATVRVLTGDYLGITSAHALQTLYTLTTDRPAFTARLFTTRNQTRSFHPKAYIFSVGASGAAFVGSSNLSETALTSGVEWNLKTTSADATTFQAIQDQFNLLFSVAEPLTPELLNDYSERVRVPPAPEPAAPRPVPHDIQKQVLRRLVQTREQGNERGLVVMATGLGKTYLSAFDLEQLNLPGERKPRALFVAHREEILSQAADTWAKVHPDRTIGFLRGGTHEPDADLVFASVQTLSQVRHLRQFPANHFDYVVIDEFHHAAAKSYRKLLDHFTPRFLLGLTATPDRLDGAALLALCDDNLVTRVGLVEGIERGQLVPFHYFGIRDELDYAAIPWRSGRFDSAALTREAATADRAEQALREYRKHAPTENRRALVFCCSTAHADFIATYLTTNGVPAAAVHSGLTSAPRADSLAALRSGDLEAIVAVDIFNEGVDLPDVNTILMLRPTESPVIFLQQLGRGLRLGRRFDKPRLVVVDFIGNHRSFMVKPQALLALVGETTAPGVALRRLREGLDDLLPPGCSVDIETEALDLLESVARLSKDDHLIYIYCQLRDTYGHRPTALQVIAAGANLRAVRDKYGTWFDFVQAMGDLTQGEHEALQAHAEWFTDLHKIKMKTPYAMVALETLDLADGLHAGMDVAELTQRCLDRLRGDVILKHDLHEHDFASRWREVPLRTLHTAKGLSRQWFALDGDRFVSRLNVSETLRSDFDAMTTELVALRLSEYINRNRYADRVLPFAAPIELVVSHSSGKPILRFDRKRRPDVPEGDVSVDLDGEAITLRFVKIAVNVATERPGGPNVLPKLMRRWFGASAGLPGTRHRVELARTPSGSWRLTKRGDATAAGQVIPLDAIPYYPELAVACGPAEGQTAGHDARESLSVVSTRTLDAKRHFVVRARGDSMNGGSQPIKDGDLVLCEWAAVSDPHSVAGKPVLLTGAVGGDTVSQIKLPFYEDGRWYLRSTNPDFADERIDAQTTLRVAGRVLEVVTERTGPLLWARYDRDAIAPLFGHQNNPSWRTGHRDVDVGDTSHSILMVNLRKPKSTPLEHRYADVFLSPSEFQWESQASTAQRGAKGQRIIHEKRDGRAIHLFVRFHTKNADGRGEPFTYCGIVHTKRYENDKPVRVWFDLETPLPRPLFRVWSNT